MSDAWADWQRDHAAALAALQETQRAYHRVAVGPPPRDALRRDKQETLEALEAARVRLDEIRARKPR